MYLKYLIAKLFATWLWISQTKQTECFDIWQQIASDIDTDKQNESNRQNIYRTNTCVTMWKQFLPFSPTEATFAVTLTTVILCCLAWSANSCLNASAPFSNKEVKYLAITGGLTASVPELQKDPRKRRRKIKVGFFSPPVSKASVSFGSKTYKYIYTHIHTQNISQLLFILRVY